MLLTPKSLPPLVSSIPPTLAQIIEVRPTPQPNPIPPAIHSDLISLTIAAIAGGGAVWMAIGKFGAKVGDTILANKQSKVALEVEERQIELASERAMREAAINESAKKSQIISNTLDLALTNVFQHSRETLELYYSLLNQYKDLDSRIKTMEMNEAKRDRLLQDICNVLKMKERDNE